MAVSGPTEAVPLVLVLLVQPPVAVQEVAFIEVQLSLELPPLTMLAGEAVRVTVGNGGPTVQAVPELGAVSDRSRACAITPTLLRYGKSKFK